jgi:hypothetical protein
VNTKSTQGSGKLLGSERLCLAQPVRCRATPMINGMRAGEGGYGNAVGMDSRDLARAEFTMQSQGQGGASAQTGQRAELLQRIDFLLKMGQPDHVLQRVVEVLSSDGGQQTTPETSSSPRASLPVHGNAMDRYLAAHSPKLAQPIKGLREEKIRQMQELMGGDGVYDGTGKYTHADHMARLTQIGNQRTLTPSMTDDDPETGKWTFLNVATNISKGAPPVHGSYPPHRSIRP